MIFSIPDVLSQADLSALRETLSTAEFVDGKLTAGWHAKPVKHNEQLPAGTVQRQVKAQLETSILKHPLFQSAVRPRALHSLMVSRYDVGMSYGRHVDNAMMGGSGTPLVRSDVSFTLFLSDPSDYDGGELVVEGADDEKAYKLEAGHMIVYPSTTLHRVDPVTRGQRLVAVGWVQSLVRDAGDRAILFDLDTARRSLFAQQGKTPEFDLISKSLSNLLRKWAE